MLLLMDGGRFRTIDLWSSDELAAYQSAPLPVDRAADYFVIGQIAYEPLVIARNSGDVLWLAHAFSKMSAQRVWKLCACVFWTQ